MSDERITIRREELYDALQSMWNSCAAHHEVQKNDWRARRDSREWWLSHLTQLSQPQSESDERITTTKVRIFQALMQCWNRCYVSGTPAISREAVCNQWLDWLAEHSQPQQQRIASEDGPHTVVLAISDMWKQIYDAVEIGQKAGHRGNTRAIARSVFDTLTGGYSVPAEDAQPDERYTIREGEDIFWHREIYRAMRDLAYAARVHGKHDMDDTDDVVARHYRALTGQEPPETVRSQADAGEGE